MKRFFLGLVVLSIAVSRSQAESEKPALNKAEGPAPDLTAGREVYEANCARCHGVTGAGDGPDAKRMSPLPRKLADGIFKFRTTASGTPPTDEDLFHTISTGLPGSRMPDFQRLPEEVRWQLVYYIRSLSPVFDQQEPEPIDLGTDPGPKKANLTRGKELYVQLGCASCHGNLGRGDGPSAATLVDNWGLPLRAADLTQGFSYRAGSNPRDIVARVLTGIDGAPMPSYADAISPSEDAWHLAYHVQSLQEKPNFRRSIEAIHWDGPLPTTLEDPAWSNVPRTDLRLSSLFYRQGEILPTTVTAITVQAVYNEDTLLFRLVWNDPSESRTTPPDALALVFNPDRRMKMKVGSLRNWLNSAETAGLESISWGTDGESAKEEISSYREGQWSLLLKRPLLQTGEPILIGVAVWDGSNQEQGRHRANSNWVNLVLK